VVQVVEFDCLALLSMATDYRGNFQKILKAASSFVSDFISPIIVVVEGEYLVLRRGVPPLVV
jgi:hypothetical protein